MWATCQVSAPVTDASIEGPSAGGVSGRRIRTTLQYPGKEEGTFDAEGYLDVDEGARRMEWGAEGSRDYSGWLAVAVGCDGASEITVHPSFGWRSVEPEMREQPPRGPRRPLGGGHSRRRSSLSADT